MDWSKWKCRCSAIGQMMSNSRENPPLTEKQKARLIELSEKGNTNGTLPPGQVLELATLVDKADKSKEVVLSDSCIAYLVEAYAWETERMCSITKEMDVEYFERGRKTEPESIELLSFVDDTPYVKNEERFENAFLSGIPDILNIGGRNRVDDSGGTEIYWVKKICDIKSCKDYPTFLYKIHKGVDPGNREQLQGYGDILECGDLGVAFTLPTMPQSLREGYKMKLAYKMNAAIDQDKEFEKAWANLERSMIFDHIPAPRRVYKIPVEPFTQEERQVVYDRVKVCRGWLANFHEMYQRLNK
jgi:hypothetical protein